MTRSQFSLTLGAAIALTLALVGSKPAVADGPATTFATPEAAATALADACEKNDKAGVLAIFGPGAEDVLNTGDEAAESLARRQFAALVRQEVSVEPSADGTLTILVVGFKKWPLPVPLVKSEDGKGFRFDVPAARAEILARRIGENELATIAALEFFPAAQAAYASADHDGDGCFEYAQKLGSTPGQHDGLAWDAKEGEPQSPLGPLIAAAGEYGKEHKKGDPWKGYFFRILTKQGDHAPGGAFNYLSAKGDMIGGFAAIAVPSDYKKSGVMTFLVGREGHVYQKDLGEKTSELADAIDTFEPDTTWALVHDDSSIPGK